MFVLRQKALDKQMFYRIQQNTLIEGLQLNMMSS